jgi:hypothetical protein
VSVGNPVGDLQSGSSQLLINGARKLHTRATPREKCQIRHVKKIVVAGLDYGCNEQAKGTLKGVTVIRKFFDCYYK